MAARPKKMIRLRSMDGRDFVVEAKAAMSSETIMRMMEDGHSPHCIPVAGVKAHTLAKVVEYWTTRPTATFKGSDRKGDDGDALRELAKWEEKFVSIDLEALFELEDAAYLLEDGPHSKGRAHGDQLLGGKPAHTYCPDLNFVLQ